MTAPRMVLAGTSYLVTRRCSERRFFLRPSPVTDGIFLYVLAVAAKRHGMLIHAFCVLSNHFHLLVTDRNGVLPAFMQDLDSLVARAVNAAIGHWEGFWSSESSYSAVAHGAGAVDDLVRKAAYILANPVSAGLVQYGHEWPGLWTAPAQLGEATFVAPRPKVFFRANGSLPDSAELTLIVPPGFASAADFQRPVAAVARDLESETRRRFKSERRTFAGRARVLAQDPLARPGSREPRRTLDPNVAASDALLRQQLLSSLKAFRRTYREAYGAMKRGVRDVLFPAGTYRLRVEFGVRCSAAP